MSSPAESQDSSCISHVDDTTTVTEDVTEGETEAVSDDKASTDITRLLEDIIGQALHYTSNDARGTSNDTRGRDNYSESETSDESDSDSDSESGSDGYSSRKDEKRESRDKMEMLQALLKSHVKMVNLMSHFIHQE